MKSIVRNQKLLIGLLAALLIGFVFPLAGSGQTEKPGDIKYTPPKGWVKATKDHAVVFSQIDQAKGGFCLITLYAIGASEGTPQKDFAREWKIRVVEPWGAEANPKTVTEPDNGRTAIAGGAQIDFQGNKPSDRLEVERYEGE